MGFDATARTTVSRLTSVVGLIAKALTSAAESAWCGAILRNAYNITAGDIDLPTAYGAPQYVHSRWYADLRIC